MQIMNNINVWGLDVFSAANLIKDQRALTSTAYKIFQERDLLSTFKIDDRYCVLMMVIFNISSLIILQNPALLSYDHRGSLSEGEPVYSI